MTELDHAAALDALETAYRRVTDLVTGLSEAEHMRPTGCAGWAVTDVLYHQLLDAQRALVAFATPVTELADRDDVTYWAAFAPQPGEAGTRALTRRRSTPGSSAWRLPATSRESSPGCGRRRRERSARACQAGAVATQGHALRPADFTAALAVESAVHYLDLTVNLPSAPPPDPASLTLVPRVLDGLLGRPLPASWDDASAAVKGTGRVPLADEDRMLLGPLAERVPLFT